MSIIDLSRCIHRKRSTVVAANARTTPHVHPAVHIGTMLTYGLFLPRRSGKVELLPTRLKSHRMREVCGADGFRRKCRH